jgi:nitrous oxidase accessory protein
MMRHFFFHFICAFFLALPGLAARSLHVGVGQPYADIRAAVASASAGDTVWIHRGYYAEGNIAIDKALTVIGLELPILDGQHRDEPITITASDVCIRGLQIQNGGLMSTIDVAGIKVLSADRVVLEDNVIRNCNFGIYLSNTNNCSVHCNDIRGIPHEEQNTGNGIHLWKCSYASVAENYITGHRDGIYFEFVTDSDIRNNLSEVNIRYGIHFMFSHNDVYTANFFRHNGAGVAVMYSHKVQMYENRFEYNWGGAAYGILLKEISDSHIWRNRFEHNTAGVYMEGASRITMEDNTFRENGSALRVQASCDENVIRNNNFFGNSFDVSTNGQLVLNTFNGNYWDKYEGYDLNRDGIGDVPYRPVSLYAMVVEQMPYGLMLMRSFMVYLMDRAEKIIPAMTPVRLMDEKPRMRPCVI